VGTLFIGNPHGVRTQDCGRHHNQRMALWEYGRDIDYLTHKSTHAYISCATSLNEAKASGVLAAGIVTSPREDIGSSARGAGSVGSRPPR
jgi:putative transposase